jgi:hypothetical protein
LIPKFEFDILAYQAPTADTIDDGHITIQFDSIVDQNNFGYDVLNGNTPDSVTANFIDAYTVEFHSLNRGQFRFYFIDTINYMNTDVDIFVGDLDPDYIDTGLQVSVNYQYSNGNCEGLIDVFSFQETSGSNMGIIWADDQFITDFSRPNLCPGMYSFYAYEFMGGAYLGAYIDTFILTNSNDSFTDSSLYNTVPDDTLLYQINNCYYDYSLPVDSVYFNLDTISLTQDSLTALFQLTIYQQQQSTYLEDTIYAHVDSSKVLDIVLYCNDSTGQKASFFRSKQFLIMLNSDGFIGSNDLNLTSQSPYSVSIFPNPVIDELNIVSSDGSLIEAPHILDAQGKRQIFRTPKNSNVSLDVSRLSKGSYFLWYKMNETWYQYKVVK